ncbi:MAG: TatD DNase family protein [Candidatus Azotimanducaceae bacterium]|jgi:TatD DNase family protein|tara:strand:- start:441 stop:1223 length:783 start_codon:yes stop_codon:yes gene_type:complete
MMLFDIGANLTHSDFSHDLADVLERAHAAGILQMSVTGASLEGSQNAVALSSRHDNLFATVGVHPHHAEEINDESLQVLAALAASDRVVAIGETGLDYFRDFTPRDQQRRAFEAQLALAAEIGKPLFLHERDAADDFVAILKAYRDRIGSVVVHCFTGDAHALTRYLDLDCHIGITGWICDERRGNHLHGLIQNIPSNRLMIETDAPYLLPRTLKPKPKHRRCEPAHLVEICGFVATLLNKPYAQVAAETTQTAQDFFRL